jgi:rhodanese-related sulfurtransferase
MFYAPGPPIPRTVPNASKVEVNLRNLRPRSWIFFFAAQASEVFEPLSPPFPARNVAYGHLPNSGMAQSADDGTVHFWLYCPTLYSVESDKVFGRHLHFVYYDVQNQTWERDIYTYSLFCEVSFPRAQDWIRQKKAIWINALPIQLDDVPINIPGSLRLPYNEKYTREELDFFFGRHGLRWSDRLILYCWNARCAAAKELKTQLDSLGFVNTFHYSGGLEEYMSMMGPTSDQENGGLELRTRFLNAARHDDPIKKDARAYEKGQPQSPECLGDIDCAFNDPQYPSTYGRCVEQKCDFSVCSLALAP